MAEQVLLNPRLFINQTKFFLRIDIEIVCPLQVQKLVFSVDDLETTGNVLFLSAPECAFEEGELFAFGVVNDSINVALLQAEVLKEVAEEKSDAEDIDSIFDDFSNRCLVKQYSVLWF
jgi:hypothetical protein